MRTNFFIFFSFLLIVFSNSILSQNTFNSKIRVDKINRIVTTNEIENYIIINDSINNYKSEALEYVYDSLQLFLPLKKLKITSDYGLRMHPLHKVFRQHNGIDLKANNDYVFNSMNSIVIDTGYNIEKGYYIICKAGIYKTFYYHLSKMYVVKNDVLKAGDIIGKTGNTGLTNGEHLHFGVKRNNKWINPLLFLNEIMEFNNKINLISWKKKD